ncbi:MAG: hypothetical protein KDD70_08260 [Bdellovibrionales bacterium]|nr:hypothetical protein [Bdellovibrionales bacterium]
MEKGIERDLNVLVINPLDRHGKLAQSLQETFGQDFSFSGIEYTSTLHRAIKSLEESQFHLVFISNKFSESETKSFFSDAEKLGERGWCSFVQVHERFSEDIDLEYPLSLGFHGVVSELGTHQDKESIKEAIQKWLEQETEVMTKVDVEAAMNILLRKIDDAASNLKRGVQTKIDAIPSEFIELKANSDDLILDAYFRKLRDRTELAEPENADFVVIPDSVLSKSLPKLERNKYTGVSTRVWRKLLKKHGVESESASTSQPQANEADIDVAEESSLSSDE